jgi:hypothetical protein
METTENSNSSVLDLFIIWVGTVASHITSSDLMVWATLIFTILKTFVLIRDEFWRDKE